MCAAICGLGAGCSGINASKSISPATFLLPGFMQADPSAAEPGQSLPPPQPGEEIVHS